MVNIKPGRKRYNIRIFNIPDNVSTPNFFTRENGGRLTGWGRTPTEVVERALENGVLFTRRTREGLPEFRIAEFEEGDRISREDFISPKGKPMARLSRKTVKERDDIFGSLHLSSH